MTIEELIQNKDSLLMDYTSFMTTYRKKETKLLLETDFKEKGCTNEKQRTAYVTQQMLQLKEARQSYENSIDIINELIRLRHKEVNYEIHCSKL